MTKVIKFILCALIFTFINGCANVDRYSYQANKHSSYRAHGKSYKVLRSSRHYRAKGMASWYGRQFHLKRTASGERYNMYKMTAAHRTLPLSSYVRVTNLKNGRHVIVKVNDRGPFVSNRLIDLSYAAAKRLGMIGHGVAPVSVQAVRG